MDIQVVGGADLHDLRRQIGEAPIDFLTLHGNWSRINHDAAQLFGARHLHGATSCLGAMTQDGTTSGVAGFAIRDPKGAYGTAMSGFTTDAASTARDVTRDALAAAGRMGELPDLVWVTATPGAEEDVLSGIESVLGRDVPIIGGSAADNSVAGDWFVFDAQSRCETGVIISVLFPSGPVSFAYQNGYSPTERTGVVTRATGRIIYEIDDQPAIDVYRHWTEGAVMGPVDGATEAAILSSSTLWPLGREVAQVGDVPFYLLAHPAVAHFNGAIELFATVEAGEKLTLMTGNSGGLVSRAGRVASLARTAGRLSNEAVAGALMIYCGGCMLSVQDRMGEVVSGVNSALDGAPFLGAFTFGEQGALVRAGNRHGNLMISCIVFGHPNG